MKQEEINSILELHRKWLYGEEGGKRADLSGADLRGADLRGADLYGADLYGADLREADLREADLRRADLSGANLSGADLSGAKNAKYAMAITEIVPREGSFVGWKKAQFSTEDGGVADCIVKLRITEDAKRSNAAGRKCRCSKAEVLEIADMDGNALECAHSGRDDSFAYRVGETVEVANFCEDRWKECAAGIHFFLTPEEAREWLL